MSFVKVGASVLAATSPMAECPELTPAVRRIFETRFGKKRIQGGNAFTSVARGLALKAMDLR
jgi:hypothetical chaperone protein